MAAGGLQALARVRIQGGFVSSSIGIVADSRIGSGADSVSLSRDPVCVHVVRLPVG